jgi:non-specific serine/threonine protein kinase
MIGTLLHNRYRLDAELGHGGMGTVYRAHDTLLDRAVAVKLLNEAGLGTEGRARRLREAQAAARLNHPNIVAVHDAGEINGAPYVVMEWVEGSSLRECPPSTLEETLKIARQLCAALEHAHAHGIVHRDLKPENVMVVQASSPRPPSPELQSNSGEGGARWVSRAAAPPLLKHAVSFQERGLGGEARVKLMDFGLARTFDSHLTTEGMIVGTLSYLAPEQALGQAVDGRTDLYALGVMLYELTTGRLPFIADDPIAVISQHLYTPVASPRTLNESIPPELDALIVCLLSKQPDQRPASAREVLSALERISAGERVSNLLAERPRHNLPTPPSRFIGRERELAEIDQLLGDPACRLVTLVGAGGMGKTRLALEVARRNLEKFPAGVRLTQLAPIDRNDTVPSAIAAALELKPEGSVTDTIIAGLQLRVLLLVVDNCEHVLDGVAELGGKILERCPEVKVLATSREPLHLAGERLYPVPGLSLPDQHLAMEQLAEIDAVRLFMERASAVRPGFALNANNTGDVIAICHSLDGMPLAIELAAARVRALSPRDIARRLDDQFRLLTGSQRADVPHHQTLQATIAWSYDLLTERERQLFDRLAVFHGSFSLEAAEAVGAGDDVPTADALDLLTSLVDKSLVMAEAAPDGVTRYRLLETLRQFGRGHLVTSQQLQSISQKYAEFYTALAESAESGAFQADEPRWLAQLDTEADNLFATMSWSAYQNNGAHAVRIGAALLGYITVRPARWLDCLNYLRAALEGESPAVTLLARAKALMTAGELGWVLGEFSVARTLSEESLHLAHQTGDSVCIGRALFPLGGIEWRLDDRSQAYVHLSEGVELARKTDDLWSAQSLLYLARCEPHKHDKALLEEFLARALRRGAPTYIGNGYRHLGLFLIDDEDWEQAVQCLEMSATYYAQTDFNYHELQILMWLGNIATRRGEYEKASALLQRAQTASVYHIPSESAYTWLSLGLLAQHQNDYETASRSYEEAQLIWRRLSRHYGIALVLHQMAILARNQGDYKRARLLCEKSLEIYQGLGRTTSRTYVLVNLASIEQRSGNLEQSVKLYCEGLRGLQALDDREAMTDALGDFGIALVACNDYLRAAHVLAFAEQHRHKVGKIIPLPEQPYHDAAIRTLREALNEATLAQAWQAGGTMTFEEILAEALATETT